MELYNQLMNLAASNEAFFHIDQVSREDGETYRVFSYRLASYTDFCQPGALEARGIMYRMEESGPTLVCRPFAKFFNLGENPFTMNLDHSKIVGITDKRDGSLISTYINAKGSLSVKSKQSLSSSQVEDATRLLYERDENEAFLEELYRVTLAGYTVNLEYTSPMNRIVLGYKSSELRVIGVRSLLTGDLKSKKDFEGIHPEIYSRWADEVEVPEDINSFVDSIKGMKDIEGFVLRYSNGLLVKEKTDWYKSLHHAKDSINFPRHLFECIIDESVDDLKSMFADDPVSMERIAEMEAKVIPKYNHFMATTQNFLEENRHLDRKEFAIKGQKELPLTFSMAMMPYLGKEVDWKGWAKKNIELFDVKEMKEIVNE